LQNQVSSLYIIDSKLYIGYLNLSTITVIDLDSY